MITRTTGTTGTVPAREPSKPAVAIGGLAVLLVVVQDTGAIPVQLLGPDVLLAAAGFLTTTTLLATAGPDGRLGLTGWYRRQFRWHAPLLVATAVLVVAVAALVDTPRRAAAAGATALAWASGTGNWWALAQASPEWAPLLRRIPGAADWFVEQQARLDPLGTAWLIGLLVQLVVVWPLVLAPLRRASGAHRSPSRLLPVLLVLFALTVVVGPLRVLSGAGATELALGTHVRLAEWVAGAAAAAWVAGRVSQAPARRTASVLTIVGPALLVAGAVAATLRPEDWILLGGPVYAAVATALLLVAVHADPGRGLAPLLGRGLPLELGRAAYPLLLLHLPLFWLVQLLVPGARPFALLVVGGALAWLAGLVAQDGVVRRVAERRAVLAVAVVLLAGALVAVAVTVQRGARTPVGTGPVVLVVGGSRASDLAVTLAAAGGFTVLDGARPGCGVLPPAATRLPAPTGTRGQLAHAPAPVCPPAAVAAADAVVVDLAADARPRVDSPDACDPAFRDPYRSLLTAATAAWTADGPARPVLVVDGPPGTRGRCLDGLLAEAVADRSALVPVLLRPLLCPPDTAVCDGSVTRLDERQRGALGRAVADAVAAELTPARVAARAAEQRAACAGRANSGIDVSGTGDGAGGRGEADPEC
ncbi:acyltransferase family protein [Pseudonocardia sp.]|uniref:acyltransferase family protein n=1 Tax=Pseudonocardia sp. TaxID=60912 RepID=UPI003D14C418